MCQIDDVCIKISIFHFLHEWKNSETTNIGSGPRAYIPDRACSGRSPAQTLAAVPTVIYTSIKSFNVQESSVKKLCYGEID